MLADPQRFVAYLAGDRCCAIVALEAAKIEK
jgi:hypothetical protein